MPQCIRSVCYIYIYHKLHIYHTYLLAKPANSCNNKYFQQRCQKSRAWHWSCIYIKMYVDRRVYVHILIYAYMCRHISIYMKNLTFILQSKANAYSQQCQKGRGLDIHSVYVTSYIMLYMLINMCRYMYMHMHVYADIYMYVYRWIYIYMHICVDMYMYVCRCIYIYMHICVDIYMYVCIYAYGFTLILHATQYA